MMNSDYKIVIEVVFVAAAAAAAAVAAIDHSVMMERVCN